MKRVRRGQAIIEYLVVSAAILGALALWAWNDLGTQAAAITNRAINVVP